MSTTLPDFMASSGSSAVGGLVAVAVTASAIAGWRAIQRRREGLKRDYVPLLKSLLSLSVALLGIFIANFFLTPGACLLAGLATWAITVLSFFWPRRFADMQSKQQTAAVEAAAEVNRKLSWMPQINIEKKERRVEKVDGVEYEMLRATLRLKIAGGGTARLTVVCDGEIYIKICKLFFADPYKNEIAVGTLTASSESSTLVIEDVPNLRSRGGPAPDLYLDLGSTSRFDIKRIDAVES